MALLKKMWRLNIVTFCPGKDQWRAVWRRRLAGLFGAVVAGGIAIVPAAAEIGGGETGMEEGEARLLSPRFKAPPAFSKLLIDADTGVVLSADQPRKRWYPASLTKLMTLYLTFEALQAGQIALTDALPISKEAAWQSATRLGLKAGEKISVEQAILALILRSANDASVVLAEQISGSEEAFGQRMNAKARMLGMEDSQFINATGLPGPGQFTTAKDMAILARALLRDFPTYYAYFGHRHMVFHKHSLPTINGILSSYAGADGLKTGFTCAAGYNLVASAERGGQRLIGVVLGSPSRSQRMQQVIRLLDQGFQKRTVAGPQGAGGDNQNLLSLRRLESLPPDRAQQLAPPLFSERECIRSANRLAPGAVTGNGGIHGWGVILGSFPKKADAQAALSAARKSSRAARQGQLYIPKRERAGIKAFQALLVGFTQAEAATACKELWAANHYCLVLNPQRLKNPKASWQ